MDEKLVNLSPYWEDKYNRLKNVPILHYPVMTVFYILTTAIGIAFFSAAIILVVGLALLLSPFYIISLIAIRAYQIFLMLFGFWWCAWCQKKHWGIEGKKRRFHYANGKTYAACSACDEAYGRRQIKKNKPRRWKL